MAYDVSSCTHCRYATAAPRPTVSTSASSNIAAAESTSTQRRRLARGFCDVGNVKDCPDHQATTRRRRRHKRRPQRQLQTSFRLSRLPHTACSQRRGITVAKFKALSCRPMCELADYCVHCPAVKIYHVLTCCQRVAALICRLYYHLSYPYSTQYPQKKLASTMQYSYVK